MLRTRLPIYTVNVGMTCPENGIAEVSYKAGSHRITLIFFDEENYCIERVNEEIKIGLGADSAFLDVRESLFGEVIASLIVLRPSIIKGNEDLVSELFCSYYLKTINNELKKLRRIFQVNYERLRISLLYPLFSRLSRLQLLYPWLRPIYNDHMYSNLYFAWLNEKVRQCVSVARDKNGEVLVTPSFLEEIASSDTRQATTLERITAVTKTVTSIASPSILQAIPASLLVEGIQSKPHPLLRDPLLLVRLDAARVATTLIDFYDQLFSLTNLSKVINRLKPKTRRHGIIRAAEAVEVEGVRTAVVKKYADIAAVKWLVAAILTLQLPKPILSALKRLNNEYFFNRVLSEKGYNVANPILLDPRRKLAAYTYIEGKNLASIVQEEPDTPLYEELGRLIASLHKNDICLWDPNPSNFIYNGSEIFIVDLEQARFASNIEEKALDIAIAIYYSLLFDLSKAAERATLFARGYVEGGGDKTAILEATKHKYIAPFFTAVPFTHLEKARKALINAIGNT
ncbi:hypothetical protein PYJP_10700 [Pyrofollis japonicus]|nr:hypothetical protein PYJP_10700 [Pyrofollis japonicus]